MLVRVLCRYSVGCEKTKFGTIVNESLKSNNSSPILSVCEHPNISKLIWKQFSRVKTLETACAGVMRFSCSR